MVLEQGIKMTYFDFNFDRDKDFFKTSKTYLRYSKIINEHKNLIKYDAKIKNASLRLWAESTIKHNLDANTDRVDHISLITNGNSKEVFDNLGKIMFKSKDKRTDEEYQILRNQQAISTYISTEIYSDSDKKVDPLSDLKKEFIEFKNLDNIKVKKIKP